MDLERDAAARLSRVGRFPALPWAGAAAAATIIVALTLRPLPDQAAAAAQTPWSCLVCGPVGSADVILNILLFLPLGLALGTARLRWRSAGALALALSVSVELLQAFVIPGRDASLSDVFSNTLGGVAGAALAGAVALLLRPQPPAARRLFFAGAGTWAGLLALVAWAQTPSPGPGPYRLIVTPREPGLDTFAGRVVQVDHDGLSALRATVVNPGTTRGAAPIAELVNGAGDPVLRLGQRSDRLTVFARTNAVGVRLRGAMVDLPAAAFSRGDTLSLQGRVSESDVELSVAAARGQSQTIRRNRWVGTGWSLVLPSGGHWAPLGRGLTAAWLGLPALVLGWWGICGWKRGATGRT